MNSGTVATLLHTNITTDKKLIGKKCVVEFAFNLDTPTPLVWVKFGRSSRCVQLSWIK